MIAIISATIGIFLAAYLAHERSDILEYTHPRLHLVYMWVSSVGYAFTLLGLILLALHLIGVPA